MDLNQFKKDAPEVDIKPTPEAEVKSNVKDLELYSDNFPFRLSLRARNFENEAEYKRFVKNTEMLVRRCNEYKLWKDYIIDVLQINECMITHESIDQVSIEVHHHIPSMYTLICSLVNKKLDNSQEFCTFDIAQEAIELHFKNKIGYVTLIKSLHEKFHNGFLTIPISMVKGDYTYFIKEYSKYMDETDIDTVQSRIAINEHNCTWAKDEYPQEAAGGR
jgi:hypothetical protein